MNDIVHALATGIEKQGHDVTVVDARTESGKSLTSFAYIAVGTVAPSVFSKTVSSAMDAFLKTAGHISGKRCYAFILNKGLRKGRVLSSLMKMMESEGMYLKKSDILVNTAEAEAVGSKLHIDKTVS
jgi:menaquinone-dependent protoporphyrinogen IX oxidase